MQEYGTGKRDSQEDRECILTLHKHVRNSINYLKIQYKISLQKSKLIARKYKKFFIRIPVNWKNGDSDTETLIK